MRPPYRVMTMRFPALAFVVLNLFDAVSTLVLIQTGLGIEKNPIMKWLIDVSPALFLFTKILVCLLVLPFFLCPKSPQATKVLWYLVVVYATVAVYHLLNWAWALSGLL